MIFLVHSRARRADDAAAHCTVICCAPLFTPEGFSQPLHRRPLSRCMCLFENGVITRPTSHQQRTRRIAGHSSSLLRFFAFDFSVPPLRASRRRTHSGNILPLSLSNFTPSSRNNLNFLSMAAPAPHEPLNPPIFKSAATTRCHGTISPELQPESGVNGFLRMVCPTARAQPPVALATSPYVVT